jgi:hypothetical protein
LERSSNTDKFSGNDSVNYRDWEKFENRENIGDVWINYEDGNSTQRIAKIETDSEETTNYVLRFTIEEPHIKEGDHMKGRGNTVMYGNKCFKEIFQTISLKLHEDKWMFSKPGMKHLTGLPFLNFGTIVLCIMNRKDLESLLV